MIIAHFSDTHVIDRKGFSLRSIGSKELIAWVTSKHKQRNHPAAIFEVLCDDLNNLSPDHIVCTGDITNASLVGEFEQAVSIFQKLVIPKEYISVVQGNHDVYTGHSQGRFEHYFAPYLKNTNSIQHERFPSVSIHENVAFIGLNTAYPSAPWSSRGRVGKDQLTALAEILPILRPYFRVLLLHHPLQTNPSYMKDVLRKLVDRDHLLALLKQEGVDLILHGHEHRHIEAFIEGPRSSIPVRGVGSATYSSTQLDRCARYNLYCIENKRLVSTETRIFHKGTFINSSPDPLVQL